MVQNQLIQSIALYKRLGIVLLCFSILRILFWLFNLNHFADIEFTVFILGLRFDFSAVFYGYSLFILMHVLPFTFVYNKGYQKSLFWIFMFFQTLYMSWNIVDLDYFKFIFRRSTVDVFLFFGKGQDGWSLLSQFLIDYFYLLLILASILWFTIFLYKKTIHPEITNKANFSKKYALAQFVFSIFLIIFFGRGGWQLRPIGLIDAGHFTKASNVGLVLNTPFSIITSLFQSKEDKLKIYMPNEEALKYYSIQRDIKAYDRTVTQNKNVVILIMESFGKEYSSNTNTSKKSFTPFLDSLSRVSMVFEHSFANGKRSIDAVPAILAGLPCLSENPFIYSNYATSPISSIATHLKKHDYRSSFFHGGKNGTMGFEAFCNLAGFDDYYGKDQYEGEASDFDGKWGILDEPFLKFTGRTLSAYKEPFLATIFTLSSHHPYFIPPQYKGNFPKGTLPIHESIGYADYALRLFFDQIKSEPWFKNTLFILTADHTAQAEQEYYTKGRGMFSVPIVFYDPQIYKGQIFSSQMQHIDIMPTVLAYLGLETNDFFFGFNRLDKTQQQKPIFTYNYGIFQIEKDGFFLQHTSENTVGMYKIANDSLFKSNIASQNAEKSIELENTLKSFIQTYKQVMSAGVLSNKK